MSFANVKSTDLGATYSSDLRGFGLGVAYPADMSHLSGIAENIGKYNVDFGHAAAVSASREASQNVVQR